MQASMKASMKALKSLCLFSTTLVLVLAGCSESSAPQGGQDAAQSSTQASGSLELDVPAGQYRLDPYHSNLNFSVTHLGLSNYLMRFSDFKVDVHLDPENLSASSVTATIDPASITTDYSGDYQATHPDSPFSGWEEALTRSPKFLNADKYPEITFTSTRVTPTNDGKLLIDGDLTLLGQTRPVTLEANLVGAVAEHPFMGGGSMGFSATGAFNRSEFGMTHLLEPPLVGDKVSLNFEGELHQVKDDAGSPDESAE